MQWVPGQSLEYLEQLAIEEAFKFYRGNKTQTANALKISPRTLDTKLEKYEAEQKERKLADDRYRLQRQEFVNRSRASAPQFQINSSIPVTETRLQLESLAQIANESKMPLPERQEVQSVLPQYTPPRRGRPPRQKI